MFKNNKGITLVSLIITIVVLLILASIGLRWIVGDHSIIKQSVESKEAYEETEAKGEVDEAFIQAETKKSINNTIDVPTEMQEILRREDDTAIVTGDYDGTITTHYKGYLFVIQGSKIVAITKDSIPAENNQAISKATDKNPGDITTDADGNKLYGSRDVPYQINSIEDLIAVADNVECGNTFENKYIKLNNSLDFSSDLSYVNANATTLTTYGLDGTTGIKTHVFNDTLKTAMTEEEGFAGIGFYNKETDTGYYFAGVFDGNEKEIQNLHIDKGIEEAGLFNDTRGIIKKLGVTGNIKLAINEDINFYKEVDVGGIAAYNSGIIINCYSKVNINIFHMDEYGNPYYAGGIVGYDYYGQIYNSYNAGMITCDSDSKVMGHPQIGGIVGYASNSKISNCYNRGDLYNSGCFYTYLGGIVGYNNRSNIKYCYNSGNIKVNNILSGGGAAGIAGYNYMYNGYGELSNCYNVGNILDDYYTASGVRLGGIIGECSEDEMDFSVIYNNYCKNGLGAIGGADIHNVAEQTEITTQEVVEYIRNKDFPYVEEKTLSISDLLIPGVYVKYDTSNLTQTYTTNVNETGYIEKIEQDDGTIVENEIVQTFNPSEYTGGWMVLSNEDNKVEIIPDSEIVDTNNEYIAFYGKTGYKYYIKILQDVCSIYLNETYGTSVRSLGYIEGKSDEVIEEEVADELIDTVHGAHFADATYYVDFFKILKNNLNIPGYCMASRFLYSYTTVGDFGLRGIYISSWSNSCCESSEDLFGYRGESLNNYWSICPVIELKNTLQVTGGSGTQEDPYILE